MTYLEVECKAEAIKTLGVLSLMDLEESLWGGKLIIEFKLRAIFSLSSTKKTLLWFDIWPWFWLGLCMCVSKRKKSSEEKNRAKGKVKVWNRGGAAVYMYPRERRQYRQQKEGSVGERVGKDVKIDKFSATAKCQVPFHFHFK